ncbi:hypothetical protein PVK06_041771 [Gossypium arboreum]|uniref:RNase H type-1 domain-containing protein n=1 Tax=Gossypium arboreum TaxID=29729 RepID=A0ABR0N949_GOSAR|nr:hypothetical protein PVK06_041771 [Gossypium arboreum]
MFGPDSCSRVPRSILVHWEKQGSDCFKLNVDGSWDQSWARAGSGGVIPDWYGNWVVGFSAFCGSFVVLLLPMLRGIFHGTGIAWRKGIPNIIIESDSSTAAEIVLNGAKNRHPYFYFIDAIQRALRRDCCWSFVHVSKERIFVADWLVKSSLSEMGMCVCSINLHKMSLISLRIREDIHKRCIDYRKKRSCGALSRNTQIYRMIDTSEESKQIEKLYEFSERLNEAKVKSQSCKQSKNRRYPHHTKLPHKAQLLFGRGFRVGTDRRKQKKLAVKNEKEMREEIR